MTDRFPLIANPTSKQIEELASGDNLNLQNSGIVGATTITATALTIPTIMTAGPMPTPAAATAMSMNRTLVVGRGRTNSLSSPPVPVRA